MNSRYEGLWLYSQSTWTPIFLPRCLSTVSLKIRQAVWKPDVIELNWTYKATHQQWRVELNFACEAEIPADNGTQSVLCCSRRHIKRRTLDERWLRCVPCELLNSLDFRKSRHTKKSFNMFTTRFGITCITLQPTITTTTKRKEEKRIEQITEKSSAGKLFLARLHVAKMGPW